MKKILVKRSVEKDGLPKEDGCYLIAVKVIDSLLPINCKNPFHAQIELLNGEWQIHPDSKVVSWYEELPLSTLIEEVVPTNDQLRTEARNKYFSSDEKLAWYHGAKYTIQAVKNKLTKE